jgi:murein DD-endopeptidase MepM/ murein hydrolase activator NlpD
MQNPLYNLLWKYANTYHTVVPFDKAKDKLLAMNFTAENESLTDEILANTAMFSEYINDELKKAKATYGVGGYDEHRTVYSRSKVFDTKDEPRRLHLGIDVWGPAGTPVFAPFGGVVHSVGFNNNFGDYGATIILQHQVDGTSFNTLYGHLSKRDIAGLQEGNYINRGTPFAHFGEPAENGFWPPHLHFQIVENMFEWLGDYPGVCKFSEREKYLANSPDPDVILQMMQYAKVSQDV